MGVYNPNMEMPSNCTECIEFKDDCEHYWDYYCTHESRPNDCPLIEIDLVRCGECKQLDQTKWCDLFLHYMNEDDFCSYGERRADDKTEESRP